MDGANVYMLLCSDSSIYCGITKRSAEERLSEHNLGLFKGYTSTRLPVALLWSEHFVNLTDAITAERRIKGWSRAKKQALAAGDWRLLRELSVAYRDRQAASTSPRGS